MKGCVNMTYTKVKAKDGKKVIGNGTCLMLVVANYDLPDYLDVFKFPAKALTSELCTLLFGRDSVDEKLKMTKNVKKSLDRYYSNYKTGLIMYSDLENFAQAENVNFGIACEKYLENNGYIKTDIQTDKADKIDLIKGNSKIQLKCAVIRDFSKKAYSMVNGQAK